MSRQRVVRQSLEDLRRAGVTHIPAEFARELAAAVKSVASTPTPVASATIPKAQPTAAPRVQTAATPTIATPTPTNVMPTPPAVQTTVSASAAEVTDVPRATGLPCASLTREQRIMQLSDVAARVAQCTRCEELARTRHQTVFGVGNPEAQIMFIGEAPGADEDRQGEPFVGAAGQLLNKIITACGLTREEIYICNILRCRPPGNRTPAPTEAANCREYLDAQIETINPAYIVCWGSVAAQNLLSSTATIGKMRGKFFDYRGVKVLCTYHPSYLLRNPSAKKDVWEDMKFFRRAQGVELK